MNRVALKKQLVFCLKGLTFLNIGKPFHQCYFGKTSNYTYEEATIFTSNSIFTIFTYFNTSNHYLQTVLVLKWVE